LLLPPLLLLVASLVCLRGGRNRPRSAIMAVGLAASLSLADGATAKPLPEPL